MVRRAPMSMATRAPATGFRIGTVELDRVQLVAVMAAVVGPFSVVVGTQRRARLRLVASPLQRSVAMIGWPLMAGANASLYVNVH